MSLFSGDINTAQADATKDISLVESAEDRVIASAVTAVDAMLRSLLDGYTIQIKAIKNK